MAGALSIRPRNRAETPLANEVYLAEGLGHDLTSAKRLVILIHGYNNTEERARESFEAFRRNIAGRIPRHELWEFHWPGNHPNRVVSKGTYFARVNFMDSLGARLAAYLNSHPAKSVCIVAHSLGCRVALETMLAINGEATERRTPVRRVFLLAAAVPVPLCDGPGSRFPHPLPGSREHVLHSHRDLALKYLFPRGQSKLDENEWGPAVGLHGQPRPRWADPVNTGKRHTQYWESEEVCAEVLSRMGIPVDHLLPLRRLHDAGLKHERSRRERFRLPWRRLASR